MLSEREALRFVSLSVSAVPPENLPIAISVILVLAMRRMARRKHWCELWARSVIGGAIHDYRYRQNGTP